MPRQVILNEIQVSAEKVWTLLTDPKEFAYWAPNVRDLTVEPAGKFDIDSERRFRLDVSGKIETLETRVTHCIPRQMFAEIPVGGSLKLQEKCKHLKLIYRLESADEKTCNLVFTLDYEMKGLMNKLLEKVVMGQLSNMLRLWFERLKTYAETGRSV